MNTDKEFDKWWRNIIDGKDDCVDDVIDHGSDEEFKHLRMVGGLTKKQKLRIMQRAQKMGLIDEVPDYLKR